jgi:hypothetical protein
MLASLMAIAASLVQNVDICEAVKHAQSDHVGKTVTLSGWLDQGHFEAFTYLNREDSKCGVRIEYYLQENSNTKLAHDPNPRKIVFMTASGKIVDEPCKDAVMLTFGPVCGVTFRISRIDHSFISPTLCEGREHTIIKCKADEQ